MVKKLAAEANLVENAKRIGMSATVALSDDMDGGEIESNDLSSQIPVQKERKFVDHGGH